MYFGATVDTDVVYLNLSVSSTSLFWFKEPEQSTNRHLSKNSDVEEIINSWNLVSHLNTKIFII